MALSSSHFGIIFGIICTSGVQEANFPYLVEKICKVEKISLSFPGFSFRLGLDTTLTACRSSPYLRDSTAIPCQVCWSMAIVFFTRNHLGAASGSKLSGGLDGSMTDQGLVPGLTAGAARLPPFSGNWFVLFDTCLRSAFPWYCSRRLSASLALYLSCYFKDGCPSSAPLLTWNLRAKLSYRSFAQELSNGFWTLKRVFEPSKIELNPEIHSPVPRSNYLEGKTTVFYIPFFSCHNSSLVIKWSWSRIIR